MMEMKTTARYYCTLEPRKNDPDGLVECLGVAVKGMGIITYFIDRICLVLMGTFQSLLVAVQMEHQ